MSTNVGTIDLDLILNSDSFKKQLDESVNSAVKNVSKTASGPLTSVFSKLGKLAAGAFAVKKVAQFGAECIQLGSDLAEVQNVVDVTFGSLSGKVNEFAKSAITSVGLSETVAKKYMGQYGSMAKAFGYSTDKAYDMSETLTKLTGDVASFYNLSTDEAQTKMKSVFTGETESLKELGVVMTQAALDQFALQKGYGKTTSAMSEQEKVALRLAFVQDKLADASGDFARTSDGWANQTRVLSLRFDALKATLGQGLINALTPAIRVLNQLMEHLQRAADAFANFTATIFGKQEAAAATDTIAGNIGNIGAEATDTANAVKKATKSLAGFDKLNVIGSSKSGIVSASSDTGSTEQKHTVSAEVDTKELNGALKTVKKFVDRIKKSFERIGEAFSKIDFSEGKKVFEELVEWAGKYGQEAADFIAGAFEEIAEFLNTEDFQIFAQGVIRIFSVLWAFLKPFFEAASKMVKQNIDFIIGVFKGAIRVFAGLFEFIEGLLTGDGGKIKNGLLRMLSGFANIFISFANFLTDKIFSAVETFINGIGSGVKKVGEFLGMNDWGWEVDFGNPLAIPAWNPPALANGGYVEANTPQLVKIGDNRHEGEIVAPESKITEAVLAALGPIVETLRELGATIKALQSGKGQNILVQCILDGKVVYETVVKQNNMARRMRNGLSPLD